MDQKKRRPLIAGNWKMHEVNAEAIAFMKAFTPMLKKKGRDVVIIPPFTCLEDVGKSIRPGSAVHLGAQDLFYEKQGAFTGEISGDMLRALGCEYVIVGHSERRHYFKEGDGIINKKLRAALYHSLIPILCVGEDLRQREEGLQKDVVERQIRHGLAGLSVAEAKEISIAYEPVWAIGTGKNATPKQAGEMHAFIRKTVAAIFGKTVSEGMRMLYGGSVKPDNVKELMSQKDIDGVLVGGASLDPKSFAKIANF